MSDQSEQATTPNFADPLGEHTATQHLARARRWAALAEEFSRDDSPAEDFAVPATHFARMHTALAAEIDRQAMQTPLVNSMQQAHSVVQDLMERMVPPSPAKTATLHQLPQPTVEESEQLAARAAEKVCMKASLFDSLGQSTCLRSAAQRVTVKLPQGSGEENTPTVNVCDPCLSLLEVHPTVRVMSVFPLAE